MRCMRLARAIPLVGLNSADFLVDGDDFRLLEINPRPGATLDIFEPPKGSLFALHIAACEGELEPHAPSLAGACCHGDRLCRTRHRVVSGIASGRTGPRTGRIPAPRSRPASRCARSARRRRRPRRTQGASWTTGSQRFSLGRTRGCHEHPPAISVNAACGDAGRTPDRRRGRAQDRRRRAASSAKRCIDCRQPVSGQHRGRPAHRRNLHGRARHVDLVPSATTPRWPWTLVTPLVQPGDRLPCQPVCRLAAVARRGQGRLLRARLRSGARAGAPRAAVREARLRGQGRQRDAGPGKRPAAAAADRRQGRPRLRRRTRDN